MTKVNETMKTIQELFDISAVGMLKQNKRSVNEHDECQYHHTNGNRCAIGFIIPDNRYTEDIEDNNVDSAQVWFVLHQSQVDVQDENTMEFLKELQRVHDRTDVVDWPNELLCIAESFKLNHNSIDKWLGVS